MSLFNDVLGGLTGLTSVFSAFGKKKKNPLEPYMLKGAQAMESTLPYLKEQAAMKESPFLKDAHEFSMGEIDANTNRAKSAAESYWGRKGNVSMARGETLRAEQGGLAERIAESVANGMRQQNFRDTANQNLLNAGGMMAGYGLQGAQQGLNDSIFAREKLNDLSTDLGSMWAYMQDQEKSKGIGDYDDELTSLIADAYTKMKGGGVANTASVYTPFDVAIVPPYRRGW
jgi:hypothetical protein